MKLGRFETATIRKERDCVVCNKPMFMGTKAYSMNYTSTKNDTRYWFKKTMHAQCFHVYVEEEVRERTRYRKAQREAAGRRGAGRPPLSLSPEKRKERMYKMGYLYRGRERLLMAYLTKDRTRIKRAKKFLARTLSEFLEDSELGGLESFRLSFPNKEKHEVFIQVMADSEPEPMIREFMECVGSTKALITALQIEDSSLAKEYGY